MKFKFIYTVFALAALGFLFISSSGGRAAAQNWGNTGAPGDQVLTNGQPRTCVSCHNNSAAIQVTVEIDVKDQDGMSVNSMGYIPGETYQVEVNVITAVGSPGGFGFQILCLNAEEGVEGPEVSNWSNASSNAQIATAGNTGRTYVEQNGLSSTSSFTADWVAPEVGSGVITFYSCGNGVNSNMANTGDGAACTTLTLEEIPPVSTSELTQKTTHKIFPNPTSNEFHLSTEVKEADEYDVNIYTLTGQKVATKNFNLNAGSNLLPFNIQNLNSGIYIVELKNKTSSSKSRLMKL